jgi:hypothetical protein
LLYVGITSDPEVRFAQHRADKAWWPQVVTKDLQWHGTRAAAAAAEIAAIRFNEPRHNREHSVGAVVSLHLAKRIHVEALDLLCKVFGESRERVLGTLLIRELDARGLLGDDPCFHKAAGWPEGLTVDPAFYGGREKCSCGARVTDPSDCWKRWRLQLEAKEAAASADTSDGVPAPSS